MRPIFLLAGLAACAPRSVPPATFPAEPPPPLPPADFQLPETQEGQLSNGLPVVVFENHEVPLVWVTVAFDVGAFADPPGQEGLAAMTLDMMNEGAGEFSAMEISAALRRMASRLDTSADLDGASVSASALVRHLEPTLDLVARVLREPTFPEDEWVLLQRRTQEWLDEKDDRPDVIASRALDRVMFGDTYDGREPTRETLAAFGTEAQRAFWSRWLHPANARILVGGDTTLGEILPLLEARLGDWTPGEVLPPPQPGIQQPAATTVYVVDRPGAPQSVIRAGTFTTRRAEEDWFPLVVGNRALGGMFTSRVNLNLREEKGWTYGARTSLYPSWAPAQWAAGTTVDRDHSGDAVAEILREVREVRTSRPLTDEEVAFARDGMIYEWPGRFERTGFLLDEVTELRRYGLPEAWLRDRLDLLRAVSAESANAALQRHLDPDRVVVVVVGDLGTIGSQLDALGLPVVRLDRRGLPVE